MKKVLVITYYWPPSGGAGVQRWLKFVKYLPEHGWSPIVYTPSNPELPVIDESLVGDVGSEVQVLKYKIWEPYGFYKQFMGLPKSEKINTGFLTESKKKGFLEKISVWIRGNCFIPDARKFWIKPSVKFLSRYLKSNPVDLIVTTGPPHSMHLIGHELSKRLKIKWLADFRDPWTNIDFYKDLKLTKWADQKHHRLESAVISSADCLLTIGPTIANELSMSHNKHVEVIPNGYDDDDFNINVQVETDKFVITHLGTLVKTRNPVILWMAINQLISEKVIEADKFVVRLIGKVDISVKESVQEYRVDSSIEFIDYIPHEMVSEYLMRSTLLLLLINDTPNQKGILTGKIFEYMASKRPIICIGPGDGDAGTVITSTKSGNIFDFNNYDALYIYLKQQLLNYKNGIIPVCDSDTKNYSRRMQTSRLVKIFNEIIND